MASSILDSLKPNVIVYRQLGGPKLKGSLVMDSVTFKVARQVPKDLSNNCNQICNDVFLDDIFWIEDY